MEAGANGNDYKTRRVEPHVKPVTAGQGEIHFAIQTHDEASASAYLAALQIALKDQFGEKPPVSAEIDAGNPSAVMVNYKAQGRNVASDQGKLIEAVGKSGVTHAFTIKYIFNDLERADRPARPR